VVSEEGRGARSAAWGVLAVVFGGGAFAVWQVAIAPKSTVPLLAAYIIGAVGAIALYMCFATILNWWPTHARPLIRPSSNASLQRADHNKAGSESSPDAANEAKVPPLSAGPAASQPATMPAPPVNIRLKPELDVATGRFRLGALNRGALGRFRVQVVDAHNQDGNWIGSRTWPVPWLEDGSVGAKEIPMFDKPLLDFAHFDFLALQADLDSTKWVRGDHWVFPSLPEPVRFQYSAVSRWPDLARQYVVITVRVIRDDPPGSAEQQFKIGNDGTEPYVRELPEKSSAGPSLPMDPEDLRNISAGNRLAPSSVLKPSLSPSSAPEPEPERAPAAEPVPAAEPALAAEPSPAPVTDHWRPTSSGISSEVSRLESNSLTHPAYMRRQQTDTPPSVRIGMRVASAQVDSALATSTIRARFRDFLGRPPIAELLRELTEVNHAVWTSRNDNPPFSFGAVLAPSGSREEEIPLAWARLLLPDSATLQYGRDPRFAYLVLYVEPERYGQPAPPVGLPMWHRHFARALQLPDALAAFLTDDLGLATRGSPPAEVALWLNAPRSLTELVEVDAFAVVPGTPQLNSFAGFAVASAEGEQAAQTAVAWLRQMCDSSLHLDGYESALDSLRSTAAGDPT
jgi:hypothetical protein